MLLFDELLIRLLILLLRLPLLAGFLVGDPGSKVLWFCCFLGEELTLEDTDSAVRGDFTWSLVLEDKTRVGLII